MEKTLADVPPLNRSFVGIEPVSSPPSGVDIALPPYPLFGTDGIRGKVGELLTASLAMQVGYWAGQVLQANALQPGPIMMGQDSRNSSDLLAAALLKGFTAAGVEVWDLGLCPTPAVAYLTSISQAMGGVMISASHNPPEDNGIKLFGQDGSKLSQPIQAQIETALRQPIGLTEIAYTSRSCSYSRPELLENYLFALQKPLQTEATSALPLAGMHIVLDLAWGAAVQLAPRVFRSLGAQVTCLHAQADGNQINVNCGSTHLTPLQTAVVAARADLGFAFDGDADRVLAVDHQGRTVDGDYILYFWGQQLHQQDLLPDSLIVSTVMSNLAFEQAWKQKGGKLIRTSVGDQHVYSEMVRSGAMLGGEQSGHLLCRHYGVTGDGLATALHLAVLVQQSGLPLAELVNQSFQTYPQQLRNVIVADECRRMNWQDCDALQQAIDQAKASLGEQGRILVRASGTEPLLRIMVEAATEEQVSFWLNHLMRIAERYLNESYTDLVK